jgi:hypothetical protein
MVFLPDNTITGLPTDDVMIGTPDSDEMYGFEGIDVVIGGEDLDLLYGNEDADLLYGSQADDTLYGGQGDDILFGGQGNDFLSGNKGNDTLYGDQGADTLTGGIGSDVVVIGRGTGGSNLLTADVMTDFDITVDRILLLDGLSFTDLTIESTETGGTVISETVTGEVLILLEGVAPEALTSDSFIFEPTPEPDEELPPLPQPLPPDVDLDVDLTPPTVEAQLANDNGNSNTDNITSDPTITGTVTDSSGIRNLEASLGDEDEFVDVSDALEADGTFTLNLAELEEVSGGELADGDYTLQLRSQDTELNTSQPTLVSFSLDTTAPDITAELANDTGDSNTDGVTTDPTISGTVTDVNEVVGLRAGSGGNLIDATSQLEAGGNFELGQLELEAFLGESLVEDTSYTLELEAEDAFGQISATTVSFTLDSESDGITPIVEPPPPVAVEMIDDDDEIPDPIEVEEREVTEDPGNTIENALSIGVSSNTLMYSNTVSGDDLEDFYVFTLGAAASISIDLDGLSSDVDLFLLDSSETVIDTSEAIGITSESINRPLEAGTYYIQVQSFDGGTTDYDLNVSFTSRIPGVNLGGSEEGIFERQTNESSQLINLSSSDPSVESFRSDPRFEGIDGSNFSVVIIDSGIDLDHPFFGPDNNGDGVADRIVYHQDFFDTDGDRRGSDSDGHGSNVSSIIASSDDVYTGMAPGANIIHLKVFPDGDGGASPAALEQALSWVVENTEEFNIASVNMSLGGLNFSQDITPEVLSDAIADPSTPPDFREYFEGSLAVSQLLEQIVAKDVIVVSASGNDFASFGSTPGVAYPSADVNSLSVGAVFDSSDLPPDSLGPANGGAEALFAAPDVIAPWSQRHPELTDIFAPGPDSTGADAFGGIVTQGGTSQASPHIAGIAALAQQLAFETLGRRLTFEEFRDLLQETGETIIDGDDEIDNVFNNGEEYKRVDVLALGEAILGLSPQPPEPPEPEPELVRYDFGYLFDGESLDNDFYIGYTYAEAGSFEVGSYYDDFSGNNEDGSNGLYLVFDDTGEVPSDAIANAVYVDSYHDVDASNEIYTPFYSANGFASGLDGLGSEYDFISLDSGSFDDFGLDYAEADGVEQIFIRDRFPVRTDYPANSEPGRMVNADLNNDGTDELIVANTSETESGFSLLFNQGDGSFDLPIDFITDSFSSGVGDDPSLDVGDIDGDGNIDLITVNPETNEVSIYFNDGNGNLSTPSTFETGDRPVISETTDVDSDGNTDIVLINSEFDEFGVGYEGDSISVLFNRTDNNVFTLIAGEGVNDVVAADLDGDGDLDLATANQVGDTVSVLFNLGNVLFTSPLTFDVGDRPVSIVADDFDGNGSIDLATSDFGSDTVSILRNSGNGIFAPAILYDANDVPSTMSAGDIDGDGDPDLVMRNSVFFEDGEREGNSISVLLNNGDATFNPPVSFTVGDVPVGLIVEDLDGNNRLDIATSNFEDQTVTVYLQA